jgi:hypothetical protein
MHAPLRSVRCCAGIVVAKLFVMPVFALGLCLLINKSIGDDGSGWFGIKDPYDQVRPTIRALSPTHPGDTVHVIRTCCPSRIIQKVPTSARAVEAVGRRHRII